jgi:hypothetical protein
LDIAKKRERVTHHLDILRKRERIPRGFPCIYKIFGWSEIAMPMTHRFTVSQVEPIQKHIED